MKIVTTAMIGLVFVGMTGLALANPSMLPKHPGYPSGGEFANDPGQKNLTHSQSILEAAKSGDTNMSATLMDEAKPLDQPEAGQAKANKAPVPQAPKGTIEPPVKEGAKSRTK